ncbi:thymidine phosphorylase [Candidatus Microgenomates bacterium]|nr:MAG: thymidine phosphorylase [Candidatus Microgenomates bacterium]
MPKKTKSSKQTSVSNHVVLEAIKKKLVGKRLSYSEIFAVMDEIAQKRLSPVLTTYFVAAGFTEGFNDDELYYLTRAMAETGEQLSFKGIVADKHSTGGVAGTRVTMILVPIIAAVGIKIPKNSSRAITSPSGTADTMEVIAPVTFSPKQIMKIVNQVGGCIVWGGHLGLAPADDIIIQIEEPLAFESFDKAIVSIMAKKVASGATHVVFDIPVGPNMKIRHMKDAVLIKRKFEYLARKFNVKVVCDINETAEPAGQGVGPILEVRDVFRVLEGSPQRPLALEQKAIRLAGKLLDLCFADMKKSEYKVGMGEVVATDMLYSGKALAKMREIIKAQGGDPHISLNSFKMARYKYELKAQKNGRIAKLNNKTVSILARILGSPADRKAGVYLDHKLNEHMDRGQVLCTFYSSDKWRLKEAEETVKNMPIYEIE